MDKPKISIIMPMHNTPGEYLSECLESIYNQSFSDWELIIVDDFSSAADTSKCLNECSHGRFEKKISIVRLRENVGAGEARNIGFLRAQGEYVAFLDSDDIFEPAFLELTFQKITKEKADICVCGYTAFDSGNGKIIEEFSYEPKIEDEAFSIEKLVSYPTVPWCKLIRKDFLERENIYFQSLSNNNDISFALKSFLIAKKICCVEEALVRYRTNTTFQLTSNRNPHNLKRAIDDTKNFFAIKGELDNELNVQLNSLYLKWIFEELRRTRNLILAQSAYEECKAFFLDEGNFIKEEDKILKNCLIEKSFSSEWYKHIGNFYNELTYNSMKLKEAISGERCILWGTGRRGKAFIKWADENGIRLIGVCDRKNDEDNEEYFMNVKLIKTYDVLHNQHLIIASNEAIFTYLKGCKKEKVINLQQFCSAGLW